MTLQSPFDQSQSNQGMPPKTFYTIIVVVLVLGLGTFIWQVMNPPQAYDPSPVIVAEEAHEESASCEEACTTSCADFTQESEQITCLQACVDLCQQEY